jgi:hypothetical protein
MYWERFGDSDYWLKFISNDRIVGQHHYKFDHPDLISYRIELPSRIYTGRGNCFECPCSGLEP